MAYLSAVDSDGSPVVFQHRQKMRLRIALSREAADGTKTALYNTLHAKEVHGAGPRGGLSRERLFLYVFFDSMVYSA